MNSVVTPLDEAAAPSGRPRAERWSLAKIERYAYDGWNMIMTVAYNGSFTGDPAAGGEVLTVGAVNGRVASYVWGPDIASRPDGHSSWQRAGGVGGLLMVVDGNGAAPGMPVTTDDHFFPLMDRLGNVTGYRKAATGLPNDSLSAVLEYDAFGQEVRSTGPASDLAPFHFSTKFTDQESGLNYYGYRYYDSAKGRWLNRDPIGETGGKNLFGVDGNNFMAYIDVLGKARPCSQKFKSNYMGYEDIIPFSTCDAYNSDPYYLPDQAQNPKGGYRNHDVYDEVGGGLDKSHDSGDRDYQDSCALRVSLALNGCGEPHRIPTGDGEPVPDGKHPKDNQIVNAKAMCAYLRKKWGPPDYTVSSVRELYLILNKNTCECFSVVFCNSHHVGHADASMVDYAGPGKNSSVWKLPCCGADE